MNEQCALKSDVKNNWPLTFITISSSAFALALVHVLAPVALLVLLARFDEVTRSLPPSLIRLQAQRKL